MKSLKTNCNPVIFKSVDDAIDYLHAEFCDLVISDLQIPFRNPTPNGVAILDTVNQIVYFIKYYLLCIDEKENESFVLIHR